MNLLPKWLAAASVSMMALPVVSIAQNAGSTTITIAADQPGTKISPDLFGVFFEDINYAADGGLYAELLQNRSFEYSADDNRGWNSLTAWELVQRGAGQGTLAVDTASPICAKNPHYAVLTVEKAGVGVGISNAGVDGVPVKQGEKYNFSICARQTDGTPAPLTVRLESVSGTPYGEIAIPALKGSWTKYSGSMESSMTDTNARLVVLANSPGVYAFDVVSLFPQKTFHNHPNGLRADLAQAVADLHPKFVRFPGGCLAHGFGIDNIYRWKDTIGPIEQRKEQKNIWRYHQTVGLGYFEYFQFCEDIGAKPLPIQAAGVCCQNSPGGQHGIPLSQMKDYVQDVLDLIEYANGPAESKWGAMRAAAGHPAPFNLEYIGIGNEDQQTPEFGLRFKMIYDAVKAKYPNITVVGTVGPAPSGADFTEGWKFARDLGVDVVDEHYYQKPEWFLDNLKRYDSYDRHGTKVYVGEYASWGNSLNNALAEAAYMTALERNGDVVRMASYAPLFGRMQHMQWKPNLIYFDPFTVTLSINYYVQQLFSCNQGDVFLPTTVTPPSTGTARSGILLGTWDTQAQFDDVKVVSGDSVLFEDTFARDARNWKSGSPGWVVLNGVYNQGIGAEPSLSRADGIVDSANYTITLRARKLGGAEGFLVGFAARGGEYDWWNIGGWDNTRSGIEKITRAGKTGIGDQVDTTIEMNRWYAIKIDVSGSRIRCYLDGTLLHDVIDDGLAPVSSLAVSTVKDTKSGDIVLKLVNVTDKDVNSDVQLTGTNKLASTGSVTVLTGEPKAENRFGQAPSVVPSTSDITAGQSFSYAAPAHSLSVIRLKAE